jgi:hypothetical protein
VKLRQYLASSECTWGKSLARYLLKHGHTYPSLRLTQEELVLFDGLDFSKYKLRQCYYNAQSLHADVCGAPQVSYAEGFATNETQFPTPHAWLSVNGKVVDPTWGRLRMAPEGSLQVVRVNHVMGILPPGWEYWGLEFTWEDVAAAMVSHKTSISLLDDYECRWPLLRGETQHASQPKKRK